MPAGGPALGEWRLAGGGGAAAAAFAVCLASHLRFLLAARLAAIAFLGGRGAGRISSEESGTGRAGMVDIAAAGSGGGAGASGAGSAFASLAAAVSSGCVRMYMSSAGMEAA